MSAFPWYVSNSGSNLSHELNSISTFCYRVSWSSILILLKVIWWHVEHLSIHMWCNANVHKVLHLLIQASSLLLLNIKLLKDLVNTPCQRFLLTKLSKSVLMCEGTPSSGKNYSWNIVSNNSNGVKSSSVKLITSYWR